MRRRCVHYLVLLSLLLQAGFGGISPAAALCIPIHVDHGTGERETTVAACHVQHGCCRAAHSEDSQPRQQRSTIDLAPPCDEGCLDCVDVLLPDETAGFGPRMGDVTDSGSVAVHAIMPHRPSHHVPALNGLPLATGPPDLTACPHRGVIRTTRLLI